MWGWRECQCPHCPPAHCWWYPGPGWSWTLHWIWQLLTALASLLAVKICDVKWWPIVSMWNYSFGVLNECSGWLLTVKFGGILFNCKMALLLLNTGEELPQMTRAQEQKTLLINRHKILHNVTPCWGLMRWWYVEQRPGAGQPRPGTRCRLLLTIYFRVRAS